MKILCIVGPTACGKKEIAAELLNIFNDRLHFISCDSRKVYRYMDIGTAKPPESIKQFFSLIDIRNPDEIYSAGDFARDAERIIRESLNTAKIPIIIGGTPLYYKALFSEFFEEFKKDPKVRALILDKMKKYGIESLYEELREKDSELAKKLHPNDWIRITRALEIIYTLGIPASEARKKLRRKIFFEAHYVGITQPMRILYEKIERRTNEMFEKGLVEETKRLLDMGYDEKLPSLNTIGYRETIRYLKGESELAEAIKKTCKNTKVYARRQLRFFRTFENIAWYNLSESTSELINHLQSEIKNRIS